jgi:SAM-dependent methyltransferase
MTGLERIVAFARYLADYRRFKKLSGLAGRFPVQWRNRKVCLKDRGSASFDRHYVYHTAWAARVLSRIRPVRHVDFSSSLYFASIVSAFIPVEFYDFNTPSLELANLKIDKADLFNLPFDSAALPSISCMHVIEHIGLGRYGDTLDPAGDEKAVQEIVRVLAPGGTFLLVVPVGASRIAFNGHRIYAAEQVIALCKGLYLVETALVPDPPGPLVSNPELHVMNAQRYGCGCFWFQKAV